MTQNIWFALPSLTALIIQFWIILKTNQRTLLKESKPIGFLFFAILIISGIEFSTYTNLASPSLFFMKIYYVACFIGLAAIVSQALKISGVVKINSYLTIQVITVTCVLLSILMLTTDILISGFEYISYSYTRKSGSFYFLVQLYLISTIIFSLALLYLGTKNKNKTNARRSKFLLVSISPLLIVAFATITFMQFGIKINTSLIFPIMMTYFSLLLLQTEKEESLFSLLMKVPFSKESQSFNQIAGEIKQFLIDTEVSITKKNSGSELSLKSLTSSIENLIVEHAVLLNEGSQIKAASLLGVSSSSICRKKKR